MEESREENGAAVCGQPGGFARFGDGGEAVADEVADEGVGEAGEVVWGEVLAIEIEVFGEAVDAVEKAEGGAADEGETGGPWGAGNPFEGEAFDPLLEEVLAELGATEGLGEEGGDGIEGNHGRQTFRRSPTREERAAEAKRAAVRGSSPESKSGKRTSGSRRRASRASGVEVRAGLR
jgi:hypothetical protein